MSYSSKEWSESEIMTLYELPFMDLLWRAQQVHRAHHNPNEVQCSSLLSIKTGGCPEDCSYYLQSSKYDPVLVAERVLALNLVVAAAQAGKAYGAHRFSLGAAWRCSTDPELNPVRVT